MAYATPSNGGKEDDGFPGTMEFIVSKACEQNMGCSFFMERWDQYKSKADAVVSGNAPEDTEFAMMTADITKEWTDLVRTGMENLAKETGKTVEELKAEFANDHIDSIRSLGYKLDEKAVATLTGALERFFLCDIGPAPFSVHALVGNDKDDTDKTVTVATHCLQMATHWLRNPPTFLTVDQLEELVVLSLFHDVYYYDDFQHHDELVLDLFKDYLAPDSVIQALVGGHLNLAPIKKEDVKQLHFHSDLQALQQEWVQMDWYLTMINVKERSRRGDGITLPLEFFHHHLGRFVTKEYVIQRTDEFMPTPRSTPRP